MSAAAERVQSENYAQDQEQSNGKGCPLSTVRDISSTESQITLGLHLFLEILCQNSFVHA